MKIRDYDVIVSDYQMPDMDGIQLLKKIRAVGTDVPFILFTGKGREEVAIEALNNGADFYLQKGGKSSSQFAILANTVWQAWSRKEGDRRIAELARIIDSTHDAVIGNDISGIVTSWNKGAERMYGYTKDEIVGRPISLLASPGSEGEIRAILAKVSRGESAFRPIGRAFSGLQIV